MGKLHILCLCLASLFMGCWDLTRSVRDTETNEQPPGTDTETGDTPPSDTETLQDSDTASDTASLRSPCEGVYCNVPSETTCDEADTVKRFAREGYCVADNGVPRCEYASYVEACLVGSCLEGTCPGSPAQGKYCFEPPPSQCAENGVDLWAYYPHGVAGVDEQGVSCIYSKEIINCAKGCQNNQCVGDPCAGVTCNEPPAGYCLDDMLVKWEVNGRCDGQGKCVYNRQEIACESGCQQGACVEESPCRYAVCVKPPANFCLDENTLYAYEAGGSCQDGACIYQGNAIACPCVNGQCRSDACLGTECVYPPPTSCTEDGKLRIWDGAPWGDPCLDGICVYGFEEVTCDQGDCVDGRCPDFCEGRNYYCELPSPPNYCDEDTAVSYAPQGTCNGAGHCEWDITEESCDLGCELGSCL